MGSSCTRRHFVLSICFLQMITIIERQVFDFLGYMWAPIFVNFFHIIFIILGFYGAYHFRIKYIITYLIWNLLWIGWNTFLICFYLEIGALSKDSDLLNLGTGSVSWFEVNGYGCKAIYSTNFTNTHDIVDANDPYRPIRPESVTDCLLSYELIEIIHSGIQCFLSCGGILGAILISYIFIDEDDRFDFVNGDAKSPQHTVVHPMYVSYSSIPTSASGTMLATHKQQPQQQQQQQQKEQQKEQQQQQPQQQHHNFINYINHANKDKQEGQKYDAAAGDLTPRRHQIMQQQSLLNDTKAHVKNFKNFSTFVVQHTATIGNSCSGGVSESGQTTTVVSNNNDQDDGPLYYEHDNFHRNSYNYTNLNGNTMMMMRKPTQLCHTPAATALATEPATETATATTLTPVAINADSTVNSHPNTLTSIERLNCSNSICNMKKSNAILTATATTAAPSDAQIHTENDIDHDMQSFKVLPSFYDDSTAKADHQFYGNIMCHRQQLQQHCPSSPSSLRPLAIDSSSFRQIISEIQESKDVEGKQDEVDVEVRDAEIERKKIGGSVMAHSNTAEVPSNLLKSSYSFVIQSKPNDFEHLAHMQYAKIKQNHPKSSPPCYNNFSYDQNNGNVTNLFNNIELHKKFKDVDQHQQHSVNLKCSQLLKERAASTANYGTGRFSVERLPQMEHYGLDYQNYTKICRDDYNSPSYTSIISFGLDENIKNSNTNNNNFNNYINYGNDKHNNNGNITNRTIHNIGNITDNNNYDNDATNENYDCDIHMKYITNNLDNYMEDILNENVPVQKCNATNSPDNDLSTSDILNVIPQSRTFYQQNGLPFYSIYKPTINTATLTMVTSAKTITIQATTPTPNRPSNIRLPIIYNVLPLSTQRLGHSPFPDLSPDVLERYAMPIQQQQHIQKRSPLVSRGKGHQHQQQMQQQQKIKQQHQQIKTKKSLPTHRRLYEMGTNYCDQLRPHDNNINNITHSPLLPLAPPSVQLKSMISVTNQDNDHLIKHTKSDDNLNDRNDSVERKIGKNERDKDGDDEMSTKNPFTSDRIDLAPHVNRRSGGTKRSDASKNGSVGIDIKRSIRPRSYCSFMSQSHGVIR